MRIPWWHGVAVATLVWVAELVVVGTVPESSPLDRQVAEPMAVAALLAWLAMPVCIVLDGRAIDGDEELPWAPTTWLWVLGSLVWLLNVVVGTAYCLRRYVAVRRTAPSAGWRAVVAGSIAAWLVLIGLDAALPDGAVSTGTVDVLAAMVALAWVAMPLAVLLDAVRVRGYTDWDPNVRGYVLGAAIPFVNIAVGGVYLYRRGRAFDDAGPDRTFALPEDEQEDGDGADTAGSPWFPRAGYVFGLYLLGMVVVAAAVPSLSETGIELLGLVAWLPFGPFFAACVYKDASWRRANDRAVGDAWWLYLLSGLVQGAAFWYLVRRATKTARYREQAEGGDGPESAVRTDGDADDG